MISCSNIIPGIVAAPGGGGLESRLIIAAGSGAFSIYTADKTTTNGSGRFRWTDAITATAGHLDAAAVINDPTVVLGTGGFDGKNVVRFDGTDDYLVSVLAKTNYKFLHDDTVSAAVLVLHLPVDDDSGDWLWTTSQSSSVEVGVTNRLTFNNGRMTTGIGDGSASIFSEFAQGPDPGNESTIHEYNLDSGNATTRVTSTSASDTTTAALSGPASIADPGRDFQIGWRPGVGDYMGTDIRAIVVLKNYSAAQLTAVRNELIAEGGIT